MPRLRHSLEFVATLGLMALLSTCSLPMGNSDEDPEPTPVAAAKLTGLATVGQTLTLDGSQSTNVGSYFWSIDSLPSGSAAFIVGNFAKVATFVPDLPGTYVFKLTVSKSGRESSTSLTAQVGSSLSVSATYTGNPLVGATLTLNGTNSTGAFTFDWALTSAPTGSVSAISDPKSMAPTFTPDVPGTYVFTLSVANTWEHTSTTLSIEVAAKVSSVVAKASYTGTPKVGQTLNLDGSASTGAATYKWTITSAPTGSSASITYPTSSYATLKPDKPGRYELSLLARSGLNSDSGTATLSIDVEALPVPVIVATITGTAVKGYKLTVDASGTTGADTIAMEFVSKPLGSSAYLFDNLVSKSDFYPDVVGTYEVKVTATNAGGSSVKTLSQSVVESGSIDIIVQ